MTKIERLLRVLKEKEKTLYGLVESKHIEGDEEWEEKFRRDLITINSVISIIENEDLFNEIEKIYVK